MRFLQIFVFISFILSFSIYAQSKNEVKTVEVKKVKTEGKKVLKKALIDEYVTVCPESNNFCKKNGFKCEKGDLKMKCIPQYLEISFVECRCEI